MLYQIISLLGAAMILAAYVAYQRDLLGRHHRLYNLLNFVGSGLLLWIAIIDLRWGFILLEAAWAMVSLPPLLRPPVPGSARPAD